MLYHVNVLKDMQNNDSEYSITESNKITTTNQLEQEIMEDSQKTVTTTQTETLSEAEDSLSNTTSNPIEFTTSYRNKKVTIHLEFPNQSNEKAADDFFSRLKEIYMKKIENKSMQLKESALQSTPTNEKENEHYD